VNVTEFVPPESRLCNVCKFLYLLLEAYHLVSSSQLLYVKTHRKKTNDVSFDDMVS
jgi:hypothetical protein